MSNKLASLGLLPTLALSSPDLADGPKPAPTPSTTSTPELTRSIEKYLDHPIINAGLRGLHEQIVRNCGCSLIVSPPVIKDRKKEVHLYAEPKEIPWGSIPVDDRIVIIGVVSPGATTIPPKAPQVQMHYTALGSPDIVVGFFIDATNIECLADTFIAANMNPGWFTKDRRVACGFQANRREADGMEVITVEMVCSAPYNLEGNKK